MTTRDELVALRHMALMERRIRESEAFTAYGHTGSPYNDLLRERAEATLPRDDQFSVESNDFVVLFLRNLFRTHKALTWVGDRQGMTDVTKSNILIEGNLSPKQRREWLGKPMIEVHVGPASMPEYVVGSVKHYNRLSDTETLTGLTAGTIQLMCTARLPAQALDLANFVAKAIRIHWKNLCHQRWFAITEIAIGGYDGNNPVYTRAVSQTERVAITPVTFTFFHQWTATSSPREGSIELVKIFAAAWGLELDTEYGVTDVSEIKNALTVYAAGQIAEDI